MTFQNETVMEIPELLDNISSVLEYSREFEESSGDNVADIRFSGRDILTAVSINETLTESDKADTLRASAKRLQEYLSPKPFAREYKALQYVIRILSTREAFIRDTIDSVDTFFDSL